MNKLAISILHQYIYLSHKVESRETFLDIADWPDVIDGTGLLFLLGLNDGL